MKKKTETNKQTNKQKQKTKTKTKNLRFTFSNAVLSKITFTLSSSIFDTIGGVSRII